MIDTQGRIFTDVAICDGAREHEVEVWFDGEQGYACGGLNDAGTLLLNADETALTAACRQPGRGDEPCDGYAVWDLTHEDSWKPATDTLLDYLDYGDAVERD